MNTSAQMAKHIRDVYFGGNWTWSNLKDNVAGLSWQQATTKLYNFNTIAALVYHMNYFVRAVIPVLEGCNLDAHDKYSFDVPELTCQEDWEHLLDQTWADVTKFADLVEQLPEDKLGEVFSAEKYGNYYRNIHGIIEHTHYHLGQLVILKKMIVEHGVVSV